MGAICVEIIVSDTMLIYLVLIISVIVKWRTGCSKICLILGVLFAIGQE